jgi:octopine/nopaline transport system permease protein
MELLQDLAWGDAGYGDEIVSGGLVTLGLAIASYLLGLVFGCLGAAAKLSRLRLPRLGGEIYTTIVRGVPELLVIYLFYFGTSAMLGAVAKLFGYEGFVDPGTFAIGTFCVGLISGAYSTEVLRGAVRAVPRGQIEAAHAIGIGLGRWRIFLRILAPQALRLALPSLGNVWQLTLKDTALVSVTGLTELMRQSGIAGGNTHHRLLFYSAAGALYLVMTQISSLLFAAAERRAARGMRRV